MKKVLKVIGLTVLGVAEIAVLISAMVYLMEV